MYILDFAHHLRSQGKEKDDPCQIKRGVIDRGTCLHVVQDGHLLYVLPSILSPAIFFATRFNYFSIRLHTVVIIVVFVALAAAATAVPFARWTPALG